MSERWRECVIYVLEYKLKCTRTDSEKDMMVKHRSKRIATRTRGRDIEYDFLN